VVSSSIWLAIDQLDLPSFSLVSGRQLSIIKFCSLTDSSVSAADARCRPTGCAERDHAGKPPDRFERRREGPLHHNAVARRAVRSGSGSNDRPPAPAPVTSLALPFSARHEG